MKKKDKESFFLSSAERIIEIMEYVLTKDNPEATIDEISQKFSISKASAYRMLNILFRRGYLDHGKGSHKYRVGFKAIEIGWDVLSKNPLAKTASPYLEKIVRQTGESAILGILSNYEVFYIEKLGGKGILRINVDVETRAPISCTSLGKALLAWSPDWELKEVLRNMHFKRYTNKTIVDRKTFLDELQKTRQRGYAITDEEYIIGTSSIAVPIRNKSGETIASLSLVIPKARFENSRVIFLAKNLDSVGKELEEKLSHFDKHYLKGGMV